MVSLHGFWSQTDSVEPRDHTVVTIMDHMIFENIRRVRRTWLYFLPTLPISLLQSLFSFTSATPSFAHFLFLYKALFFWTM